MKHEYSILCDDVRLENTGKLIIIGVYPDNNMGVALPTTMGAIGFYQVLVSDRTGSFPFRAELVREDDQTVLQAIEGMMAVTTPGPIIGMLSFRNVQLTRPGRYLLDLVFQDQRLRTAEFTVTDQNQANQNRPADKLSPPPPRRSRSSSR